MTLVAQAKAPITHEDVWLFKRLSGPKLSPDGRWVVVSVKEPAYDKKEEKSDLWLLPVDGKRAPRRLTGTAGGEGGFQWSPSGDRLVFTAKRGSDEHGQLYLLDMTGPGEAQKVADLPLACSNPQFSPDGRKLLFEMRVYPGETTMEAQKEAAKQFKDREEQVSDYEGFPIRHWDHWLDQRKVRLFLINLNLPGEPRDLIGGSSLVKKSGFAGVPTLSHDTLQATFSPDGREVVFVAAVNRDRAVQETTRYRLYRVSVNGGEPAEVPGPTGSVFEPTFGPDGRLYTLREQIGSYVYNLSELWMQDWPPRERESRLPASSTIRWPILCPSRAGPI